MTKVEWLLRKRDLPSDYDSLQEHLSEAEVFPSGQINYVPIESIMRKCYLLSEKEYEELTNAGDCIHFSRAVYDSGNGKISPDPSSWKTYCMCQQPINPDRTYIYCEGCEEWFHRECITGKVPISD